MKIIVPMAGMGKRMRPHSLTVPKPLIPVAGKPIVQRLMEDITAMSNEKVDEIAFIIGRFGEEVEKSLLEIAKSLGAKGSIYYQDEALGTAHAIYCAEASLKGSVVVAFADTLFRAQFKLNPNADGTIWVNKVEDPRAFGVVKLESDGFISDFIEKPEEFVSDLAIIGIYHFKSGETLREEIKFLLDNNIKEKGEFQLTNALENMKNKGMKFAAGEVEEWLDCGNKNATVYTNQRVLDFTGKKSAGDRKNLTLVNSVIIEPCYIGNDVHIENSVLGPYLAIGNGTEIKDSRIENSIIQTHTKLKNVNVCNSMIGNSVKGLRIPEELSIGDFTEL